MDDHVDYPQFVARLRTLVQQGASATLRMVTDDHHFVNVGLQNGRIVSLFHGPHRGARAMQHMRRIRSGGLSLLPEQEMQPQPDLPATDEILRILDGAGSPQAAAAPAAGQPSPVPAADYLGDLHRIEQALLHHIGPIAKLLMQDILQDIGRIDSRDDLERLVLALSQEIADPGMARRFIEQALG